MLLAIRSDRKSFRTITFQPGMNVVLAERTKDSTEKDSRNGIGKSTLLEIIHFCLGSQPKGDQGVMHPSLNGWTFYLDLLIGGKKVTVGRNTAESKVVTILPETVETRPGELLAVRGGDTFPVGQWTDFLGEKTFGLPADGEGSHSPTFRSLIAYFIRVGRNAYSSPFETYPKMKEWQKQVYVSFLLGLEWTHAREWQALKDKKSTLETLKRASKQGLVRDVVGSIGEMEARQVQLEQKSEREAAALAAFKVHPQYSDIEADVSRLTQELHAAGNQDIEDRQLLDLYRRTTVEEAVPDVARLSEVYEQAGVLFPELVRKRLEDVQSFHRQVVENRHRYLGAEIHRLEVALNTRQQLVEAKSAERGKLMGVLQTHGALDEFRRLHNLHGETEGQLQDLRRRIEMLKQWEEGKSKLVIEEQLLYQRAMADLHERKSQRQSAMALFDRNCRELYANSGKLVIDVTDNGFAFDVEIERSKSEGVGSMKVFCFDLVLAQLWASKKQGPGFLIHDSTVFDGVDERQVAHALELATREAAANGFQYICTLNSDRVPWSEFSEGFDLREYVRLELTDQDEAGCLLGIRF
jgi:uncharacterized protein YydD (DUF2326 family)